MLAVISDLHFQHTSHDVLRYPDEGRVQALRIERNVTADAFRRWFASIHANVERRTSREVVLLFAGDIFELHRTPLWFFGGDPDLRPTHVELGPDAPGNALRDRVHAIFDEIEAENRECWAVLRRFVREGAYHYQGAELHLPQGPVLTARYLPGNHDRLANAWPSVRARVAALLSLTDVDPAQPFPNRFDYPRAKDGTGYGVRVRHGHEYDSWNFPHKVDDGAALDLAPDAYLPPTLGDYLTTDVATRLCLAFRAHYGRALRAESAEGASMRRLYVALTEFDDVRPFSLLLTYLARQCGHEDAKTFELLRPVLRDVAETVAHDPFVKRDLKKVKGGPLEAWLLGEALKRAPFPLLDFALKQSANVSLDASVSPAELARHEPGLEALGIDTVVAGHTHLPDQVPLPHGRDRAVGFRTREEGAFFLDSGTWRTSVRRGAGNSFGRVRAYTMVFAYDHLERRPPEALAGDEHELEGRRFETWTGHIATGFIGPRLDDEGPLAPAAQQLRLLRLDVHEVDEGKGWLSDGAELRLHFGVDGEGRRLRRDGVRDGDVLDLTALSAIPLLAGLDGELWFTGIEEDLALGPIDPHDLLPWAVFPLAREKGGAFAEGERSLRIEDRAGTRLVLHYAVGPLASVAAGGSASGR